MSVRRFTVLSLKRGVSEMYTTMADLKVVAHTDSEVTMAVNGLKNCVALVVRMYERGAVVNIPWALRERLGYSTYDALKAVLRPIYGHVETRTATDPRFVKT